MMTNVLLLKITAMMGLLLLPPLSIMGSTQQQGNSNDTLYVILDGAYSFMFSGQMKHEFFMCTNSLSPGQTCRVQYHYDEGCSGSAGSCCFNVTDIQSEPLSDSQFRDVVECQPPQFPTNFTLNCELQTARNTDFPAGFSHDPQSTALQSCTLSCRDYKAMYTRQNSQTPSRYEVCELKKSKQSTTEPSLSVPNHAEPTWKLRGKSGAAGNIHERKAGLDNPHDSGQDTQALAIGVGLACAVAVTAAVVAAILVVHRRKRQNSQQKVDHKTSRIQPYGDAEEEDNGYIQLQDSFHPGPGGLPCDSVTARDEYEGLAAPENVYNKILDGETVSTRGSETTTLEYELCQPAVSSPIQTTQLQTTTHQEKEGQEREEDRLYLELSNEDTESGIDTSEYSLGACTSNSLDADEQRGSHVYNRVSEEIETSGDSMENKLKTYSIATHGEDTRILNSHVYNSFDESRKTHQDNRNKELQIYDLAKEEVKSPGNVYDISNEERELSERQMKDGLESYHVGDRQEAGRDSHIYNSLNDSIEVLRENLKHEVDAYNVVGEEEEPSGREHIYNRLNEKHDTPQKDRAELYETYNIATRAMLVQKDNVYNRLNEKRDIDKEILEDDLGTYNIATRELTNNPKSALDQGSNDSRNIYSLASTIERNRELSADRGGDYQELQQEDEVGYSQCLYEIDVSSMTQTHDVFEQIEGDYFTLEEEGQEHGRGASPVPSSYKVLQEKDDAEYFTLEDGLETDGGDKTNRLSNSFNDTSIERDQREGEYTTLEDGETYEDNSKR